MITIRPIEPQDRAQLLSLVEQQDNFNAQEVEVAIEVIDDTLDPAKNDYSILVAIREGQGVVGFICYGEIPMTDRRFDLYWVAVAPALGRQGVGRRLLARMERDLRAQGSAKVYVDTSSTPGYDRARSFYEKNGYQVACVLHDFYRDGDDKVIYLKEI
ncbi:MAG: GNAT family N-acetyltransferase [Deltaproteobacteria bacterium]|jgi:ribosomal protein S18 acetylase RimI-like enzyme|uniref:GNAT family N-acetyltransferase n=1 Tax=Hydrosulfovibrio ferrireducens TaxID=2934181 RepID=UPI00122054F9|nr:MAG: GNAT family N-acetyltransferase [Deltaproteobacteria bacterium]